jgi:hypothetical protein
VNAFTIPARSAIVADLQRSATQRSNATKQGKTEKARNFHGISAKSDELIRLRLTRRSASRYDASDDKE